MTAQELDDLYTRLCHGLTAAGEGKTPMILARLVMLMMRRSESAATCRADIDDALYGLIPEGSGDRVGYGP
ncbi:MAG: hypothetical protein JSR91_02625 [Proteobacteria bacterium]|nr:hypothetical protein [Pseudomonadota bacterium]